MHVQDSLIKMFHSDQKIPHYSINSILLLCAIVTLKRSNTKKDGQDPTCDHGGSSQRTHVVMRWRQEHIKTDSRPHSREPGVNLRSLYTITTTTDTTITTSTLISRPTRHPASKTKSWGREPLALWDKYAHTVYTGTHIHMLEKRGWEEKVLCDLWKRGSRVKKVRWEKKQPIQTKRENTWQKPKMR